MTTARTESVASTSEDEARRLHALVASHAHRLAYMLTGDVSSADDVTQETFVRVYRKLKRLDDPDRLSAYVYRTVINVVRKQHRSHQRRKAREDSVSVMPEPAPVPDVETRQLLWRALLQIPIRQRAAVYLRYYEDLSEERAAAVLECSVPALKSLSDRGLRAVRKILDEEEL